MSKFSRRIMMVLAMSLILVMIFAGCASTKQDAIPGGDAAAKVESNGGLAVKQGDYLYYINGLAALSDVKEEKDNTFGNVVKGSIMRGKLDANGNVTETKVIVPLIALGTSRTSGINVYGNWIYYTTPCVAEDKNHQLLTNLSEFMRTSIDGTTTEKIATLETATVTEFMFTPSALIYLDNGKLNRVNYNDNGIGSTEVIAEKVQSVVLPKSKSYDPSAKANDVVFFTVPSENDKDMFNVTKVVGAATGSEAKVLIDGKTYTADDNKKEQYTITLKDYNIVEGGIELYYEKANQNNPENKAGLFGALYANDALDTKNEVRFTSKSVTGVYPVSLEKGMYVFEGTDLNLMKEVVSENGTSTFFDREKTMKFGSGVTIVDFIDYKFENTAVPSVLYMQNGKLFVRAIDDKSQLDENKRINAKALSDEAYGIDSSWLGAEIIGNKVYFFNNNFYNYVESMDLATGALIKNADGKLTHPMANLNEKDKKAEEDKAKAEADKK